MNVFTRDNTNDGDAWNDRLAYIVPTGYYGYPSRFMHFPGEFIDCLDRLRRRLALRLASSSTSRACPGLEPRPAHRRMGQQRRSTTIR